MKRETRKTLVQVERMNDATFRADQARDVLASDARQRAKIRDLKARLKAVRASWDHNLEDEWHYVLDAATDLRRKNWRKP